MAKKLIKYGKFLVSVALIFCMLMPSYASLSASDGSAFVTKSEFDSAISDFNARLTTFEAGINSKIDSQVTSYLDRNGIWSGQAITYTASKTYDITAADFGGALTNFEETTKNVVRFVGENKKSGLAFINFKMRCTHDAGNGSWRPYIRMTGGNGWTGFESMMYLSLVGGQYDIANKEEQKYSQLITRSDCRYDDDKTMSNTDLVLPLPADASWSCAFFVSKGKIWLGLNLKRLNCYNDKKTIQPYGWEKQNGKCTVSIGDAYVY